MSRFSLLIRSLVLVFIVTLVTVTLNIQVAPDLTAGAALPMADTEAPLSAVEALPEFSKDQVTVKWSGYDPGDSGIQSYDVQYRDVTGSSPWTDWQMGIVTTTASFTGTTGRTYAFRSRALDYAQNQEDWPAGDGDAHTTFYAWAITGTAHTNTGSPLAGVSVTTKPSAQGLPISDSSGQYSAYVITPSNTYTVSWAKNGYGNLPTTTFRDPASTPIVYQGTLPAQGNVVTVGGLKVGQTYRIAVKGTYQYSIGGGAWADAQWAIAGSCTPGVFCHYAPGVSFNGVLLAAQNGQSMVDPNHEYTFLWTANAPQLQLYIMDSNYFDNSGALAFELSPENTSSLYQGELSAQGDVVTLSGFQVGQIYRIIMRGMFEFSIGGGSWADAQWTTWSCPSMVLCLYFGAVSFNGVQLAAQNGQDVVDPDHEYTVLWVADAPQLQMYILDSDYNDNSGHLTFEIFNYEASNDPNVFLPPADDLIRNGHFEQGTGAINNWVATGVSTPTVTIAARHTGRQSAFLRTTTLSPTSVSTLAQVVTIPVTMTSPILSFLYQPGGIFSLENGLTSHWKQALTPEETTTLYSRGQGLTYPFSTSAGELDIQVTEGVTTTTVFTTAFDTTDWTHQWLDLTPWKGQAVTLTFTLHGTENLPAQVYLDEVTLGSGYPDTWVQLANPPVVRLGSTITYQLTYGNQELIPAYDVQLTATLPAQVTFVAASLPPTNISNSVIWDLGDLAAQSGPQTIQITAAVTSTITSINTLTNTVSISPAMGEIERANNFAHTNLRIKYELLLPIIFSQ